MQIVAPLSLPASEIVGNPQFSYFSFVYRRPTNFSTEFVTVAFDGTTRLDYGTANTFIVANVPRVGDLMMTVYLSFTLPDIYADDTTRFRWVDKVACALISEVRIKVGGQIIERFPGSWLDLNSELALSATQRAGHDRLSGNVPSFTAPAATTGLAQIQNNDITYAPYPAGDRANRVPSIRGRQLWIPLPVWFSRTPGHALPLIALQGAPVEIDVDVRPWNALYQLWDQFSERFCSPNNYPVGEHTIDGAFVNTTTPQLGAFLEQPVYGSGSVDLLANLECEYAFLGAGERESVATVPRTIMIDVVRPTVSQTGLSGSTNQDLVIVEPTRELVWMFRRTDALLNNDYTNTTAAQPADDNQPALLTATLLLDGIARMDAKPGAFFDTLQPLQYHVGVPRPGVHVWSFALAPDKPVPSGFLDLTGFHRVQLQITLAPLPSPESFQLDLFALTHNFLTVANGVAGLKFAV